MFKRINNSNGFAISSLLYGMALVAVLVVLLLVGTAYFTSVTTQEFVSRVENELNEYADSHFYGQGCPKSLYDTIRSGAQLDSVASEFVSSSTGIDFSKTSSDTNGKGVYKLASTKDDMYPVFYYRGSVDNNNVKFANFCWKIVRTTNNGGIKLLYNGRPNASGQCIQTTADSSVIGTGAFNESDVSLLAGSGYMYGKKYKVTFTRMDTSTSTVVYGHGVTYSNGQYTLTNTITSNSWTNDYKKIAGSGQTSHHYTCFSNGNKCSKVQYIYMVDSAYASYIELADGETSSYTAINKMKENVNDSAIKVMIDNWYRDNLTSYTDKIEDAIWCNNRYLISNGGLNPNSDATVKTIQYEDVKRMEENASPLMDSYACNVYSDNFTVSSEIGNGVLKYSIGLLTLDEMRLAGHTTTNYLVDTYMTNKYNGNFLIKPFWTMTPYSQELGYSNHPFIYYSGATPPGSLSGYPVDSQNLGVRPSIVINHDAIYYDGDGSSTNPYSISE